MPYLAALRPAVLGTFSSSSNQAFESIAPWWKLGISTFLVVAGGAFAGLTLGLMGLDELHIRVIAVSSDNEKQRADARTVLGLLKRGRHWILVTLLLSNVIVNESLPIFLDSIIGGGIAAVVISTALIVIFGLPHYSFMGPPREVVPQALCSRYGMSVGARSAKYIVALMWVLAPIAYPIARLLDYFLGTEEEHTYNKAGLQALIRFHLYSKHSLRHDEVNIINNILSLSDKPITTIMTPLEDAYTLSEDDVLDQEAIEKLRRSGFSFFPVRGRSMSSAFIGCLSLNELIGWDPKRKHMVSEFVLSSPSKAPGTLDCLQVLNHFQNGLVHMLVISDGERLGDPLGILSLQDVVQELLGSEGAQELHLVRGGKDVNAPSTMHDSFDERSSMVHVKRSEMNYNTMV